MSLLKGRESKESKCPKTQAMVGTPGAQLWFGARHLTCLMVAESRVYTSM